MASSQGKKQKPKESGPRVAPWLITYGDMMTLLVCFFLMMVSKSTIDARRQLVTMGSIIGSFGIAEGGYDARTTKDKRSTVEPGPMEGVRDLEMLKPLLWEDNNKDLDFRKNKYLEILSINEDVLFAPGQTTLSENGARLLKRMLPVLLEIPYPILVAGHTAVLREEQVNNYKVDFSAQRLDPSWIISFQRALSVYQFFMAAGMDPEKLRMEAFGRYRPRFGSETAQARSGNRRVDLVLDRRNQGWGDSLQQAAGKKAKASPFMYKDFRFDIQPVTPPPTGSQEGRFQIQPEAPTPSTSQEGRFQVQPEMLPPPAPQGGQ